MLLPLLLSPTVPQIPSKLCPKRFRGKPFAYCLLSVFLIILILMYFYFRIRITFFSVPHTHCGWVVFLLLRWILREMTWRYLGGSHDKSWLNSLNKASSVPPFVSLLAKLTLNHPLSKYSQLLSNEPNSHCEHPPGVSAIYHTVMCIVCMLTEGLPWLLSKTNHYNLSESR